ncbi:MAG: hypothetical protein ACOYCB_14030 [Fastidiosipilaceae bacterium]|jgi:hypothetical protein
MSTIPLFKSISVVLGVLYIFIIQLPGTLFQPQHQHQHQHQPYSQSQIQITSWNGYNQYHCLINNKAIIIYLEDSTEDSTDQEYNPSSGKIKIIFKDDKNEGTTFIYERDFAENIEINETDKKYIERILATIESFHKDNRTYNQIKNKLDTFWKGLKRNGSR